MGHVDALAADYGGTDIYPPLRQTFIKRCRDMNLQVFLLTDGETWDQESLLTKVYRTVSNSAGSIRLFSMGIGSVVSHALVEGVAHAGSGFCQIVAEDENMNRKSSACSRRL